MSNGNENDIGGKVGLDITDFKANVAELNRQIKVIDTGFKAAAAGMEDWGKSEEGLQTRINALNQITDLQRQKVENLTEIYKKVAAEKGEGSKAAQDLQVRINKETEALNKNLKELKGATEALEKFGDEANQSTKDIDKLGDSVEETSLSLQDIGGNIATAAAAGIAAIGAAAIAAVGGLLTFGNDSARAMNNFQAQTGYATEEMEQFRDIASEIYADNFGESVDDIARSMAVINQTTKQTGEELKQTTKLALLMRDTFGFEVNESINTVNSLMANFKVTAEEAYNMIAQGAQNGANKNGDLLDVMREYGPHFKQLGFNIEEFADTLIQGAASGAFQIDKVGDAVKEFSIRSKDGSKTSAEGFAALGLNAQEMFKTFAKGGPEAEKAFQEVIRRLYNMKDPLAQNQAGVALFGTMFEDLGMEAIYALSDVEDYAKTSVDALGQINQVKYDDVGSALQGIGRFLITSIAEPVEKELLPKINEFVNNLKNVDTTPIVDGFKWLLDNANNIAAGAVAIGTGMLTWNVAKMIDSVVQAIKAEQLATEGLTLAQAAYNLVLKDNPIGIVITLIAALVAAIIYLWNTNDGFRNAVVGAWDAILKAGEGLWGWLIKFFTEDIPEAFTTAIDWFKELPDKAAQFFNELPGKIGYAIGLALGTLIKWGADGITWVTTEVPKIITGIINYFSELPAKIGTSLSNTLTKFVNWASNMITKARTEVPKIISNIVNFFADLPKNMLDIGGDIVKGLWDGISGAGGWLLKKVKEFAKGVVDGMKDALGIHSPSIVMRDQVGTMIGAGMAEGIADSAKMVDAAMTGINKQLVVESKVNVSPGTGGAVKQSAGKDIDYSKLIAAVSSGVYDALRELPQEAVLEMDGTKLGRILLPRLTQERQRLGLVDV